MDEFVCGGLKFADFSPLRGAPLRKVTIPGAAMVDLSFLADAPLEELDISWSSVANLSPLAGKPLLKLQMDYNLVSDLSPLRGAPIEDLNIRGNDRLTDLTPLLDLPKLEKLRVSKLGKLLAPLRHHPTLKFLAYDDEPYRPAAEFWAAYDAPQAAEKK